MTILRYVIMGGSTLVFLFGVFVIAGVFVPQGLPRNYRIVLGAVISLYGIYRFVVAYYRKDRKRGEIS